MKLQRGKLILLVIGLLVSVSTGPSSFSSVNVAASPDVGFRPVTGPPFDAPDIWVDSPINGLGTYFAGMASSSRTPVGSGDPLWPQHVHRVYARVHNFGDARASNLTINFYIRQPAGIGDGGFWQLIGTLNRFGPIQPGAFRDGFIEWKPLIDMPTSIKVEIVPLAGEASTSNNSIIEGSFFFAADQSPAGLPEFDFLVHNPSEDASVTLFFEAVVAPQNQSTNALEAAQARGWQVIIDPETRRLRAGHGCHVHASLVGPDPCESGDGAPAQISIRGSYNFVDNRNESPMLLGGATIFARSTKLAAMDLMCPEQLIPLGTPIAVTGRLLGQSCQLETRFFTPLAASNQPIALEYHSPTDKVMMHMVRTSAQGAFRHSFTPNEVGVWMVVGTWVGDSAHSPANSGPCFFEAGCLPPDLAPINDPITLGFGTTLDVPLSVKNTQQTCPPLTFSISPRLSFVALFDNGDGTGRLRLAPRREDLGTHRLTVTVRDGSSPPRSDSQTITIQVTR